MTMTKFLSCQKHITRACAYKADPRQFAVTTLYLLRKRKWRCQLAANILSPRGGGEYVSGGHLIFATGSCTRLSRGGLTAYAMCDNLPPNDKQTENSATDR